LASLQLRSDAIEAGRASGRAPALSLDVDDVVEVESDDDVVVPGEQEDAAAVDGEQDVVARQRRTVDAVRLEHGREVQRPDRRRAGYQLVLDLTQPAPRVPRSRPSRLTVHAQSASPTALCCTALQNT